MRLILVLLTSAALVLVSACATDTAREAPRLPDAQKAEQLVVQGRLKAAADLYLELAERAPIPDKTQYLLNAAGLYLALENHAQTQSTLERIERGQIAGRLALQFDLLAAELALQQAAPEQALAYLVWEQSEIPPEWRVRFHRLRALALAADGQYIPAARERLVLAQLLDNRVTSRNNRMRLINTLLRLPPDVMQRELVQLPADDLLRGWLALAYEVKTRLFEGEPMREALAAWQRAYPGHPAGEILAEQLIGRYEAAFRYPDQIALLLPLSGPYAGAAKAIRNGFFMAYYGGEREANTRPAVRVYDTGGKALGALDAYRQAVFEGAGMVVGPLAKDAVEQVLAMPQRPVPVLALNYPDENAGQARVNDRGFPARAARNGAQQAAAAGSLLNELNDADRRARPQNQTPAAPAYLFGLMPEQEARQAAEKMLADGYRRVLVLVPADAWGARMLQAFVQRFTELGGFVSDIARFDPNQADHSQTIQNLLGLSAGRQRARELEQALGRSLAYVAHPRDDADALFLAAHPRQARLIKPQLRFFQALDLPVYGTSHLYAGVPQPAQDVDLNAIFFPDSPWILGVAQQGPPRAAMANIFATASAEAGRLYALGADAYRVIPYLTWLADHPIEHYPGLSGRLSIDDDNRIHRRLAWAQFQSGVPVVVDRIFPPPRSRRSMPLSLN